MPNELNRLMEKELAQRYPKGTNFVVLGHEKLGGPETAQLRRALRDSKIRLEVVKNSVAVRVLEAHGLGSGAQFLQGPSVLATGDIGMPEMCKLLADCARKFEKRIFIRGGVMDSVALSAEGVAWLASIPPLPVLRAQMIGSVQAPIVRVAGAFQSILRSMACAFEGLRKQKESTSPPPAPPAAASGPAPGC